MFETNEAAHGAGLAANQIGDDRRIFIYDCPDHGTRRRGYVVNPTIETSAIPTNMPDPDDDSEGCLSVPGENFPTGRADWAKVTGVDAAGEPVEVEGTGFFARCLQHEVDHLDGYLYLDRLIGKNARAARKAVKANGWGVPGPDLAARHRPGPVRSLTPADRQRTPDPLPSDGIPSRSVTRAAGRRGRASRSTYRRVPAPHPAGSRPRTGRLG